VSGLEAHLTRHWYRAPGGAAPLAPLAWLYGGVVQARAMAYRRGWCASHAAGRPVLVVGNLTVGGTGKTPLTVWLAQAFAARGLTVGIVSRGFGGQSGQAAPRAVHAGSSWQEVGDEPLLLAQRTGCQVVVCRDRVAAARQLVAQGAQIILADDGLQHLRLQRDSEIIVIDGARGFGNGRLLPAGPLREPVARLARADAIVVNGAPEHPSLAGVLPANALAMRLEAGQALPLKAGAQPAHPRPLEAFRGRALHAVAGIGNPARFFGTLTDSGLAIIPHAFPDHHPFTRADLDFGDGLPVLMTEKDAVKCRAFAQEGQWYVPVTAAFSEAEAFQLLGQVSRKLRIPEDPAKDGG
jgi:tetraacyldisaccharide 4'-kinase